MFCFLLGDTNNKNRSPCLLFGEGVFLVLGSRYYTNTNMDMNGLLWNLSGMKWTSTYAFLLRDFRTAGYSCFCRPRRFRSCPMTSDQIAWGRHVIPQEILTPDHPRPIPLHPSGVVLANTLNHLCLHLNHSRDPCSQPFAAHFSMICACHPCTQKLTHHPFTFL